MTLRSLAASTLAVLAVSTSALAAPVSFSGSPAEVTAKVAGMCLERGHNVVALEANQVKCEVFLPNERKGHLLFTKFGQRRYTSQVRQFVGFMVVPVGDRSMVQPRQWVEAVIGGSTRSVDLDDQAIMAPVYADMQQLSQQ